MLLNELFEVSLGSYRNKASMSRGQAQMGAMFGRDAEQRAQDLATYKKRDAGIKRADARIEKSRQADAARRLAADVAALPDLEAKYQEMVAKYKSLGGSDWQYADREQNLTDREREARSMEGPMNNLWRQIQAAKKSQGVAEMDSQGYTGTRDQGDPYAKGSKATPVKTKDVVKQGVKALNKAHPGYSKHEKKLISKMSNAEKVDKGWRNPNTPNK